jgi:hypothetical protein
MHFLTVALVTIGWGIGNGGNLPNLMPKRSMTARAFDLMIRDMFLMRELGGVLGTQYDRLIMTLKTLSLGHMAVSLNDTEMALHTGYPS